MPESPLQNDGLAATIRSLVQPERGQTLPIGVLSDDQLRSIVLWMKEGKSNELIGRTIVDHWGKCTGTNWYELQTSLKQFRERIFRADLNLDENPELLFDPAVENATFIKELQAELQIWKEKAKADPTKPILEHIGRLGKLLADTIANHANILMKLEKTEELAGNAGNSKGKGGINIDKCQIILNELSGAGMGDFVGAVATALESAAKTKGLPSKPRKTTAE